MLRHLTATPLRHDDAIDQLTDLPLLPHQQSTRTIGPIAAREFSRAVMHGHGGRGEQKHGGTDTETMPLDIPDVTAYHPSGTYGK